MPYKSKKKEEPPKALPKTQPKTPPPPKPKKEVVKDPVDIEIEKINFELANPRLTIFKRRMAERALTALLQQKEQQQK